MWPQHSCCGIGYNAGMTIRDQKCTVYGSVRRPEHYLFVAADQDMEDLPEGLLEMLGELYVVLDLDLASREELANADIELVREQLSGSGYYLQMPVEREPAHQQEMFVPGDGLP